MFFHSFLGARKITKKWLLCPREPPKKQHKLCCQPFSSYKNQRLPYVVFLDFKSLRDSPNRENHAKREICLSKSKAPPSTNIMRKLQKCCKNDIPWDPRKFRKIRESQKKLSETTQKSKQTNIEQITNKTPILNQKLMLSPSGLTIFIALFPSETGDRQNPGNDSLEPANRPQKISI